MVTLPFVDCYFVSIIEILRNFTTIRTIYFETPEEVELSVFLRHISKPPRVYHLDLQLCLALF